MYSETPPTRGKAADKAAIALLLVAIVGVSSILLLDFSSSMPNQNARPPPTPPTPVNNPSGELDVAIDVLNSGTSVTFNTTPGGLVPTPINSTYAIAAGNFSLIPPVPSPPLSPVSFTIIGVGLSQPPLHLSVPQPGRAYVVTTPGLYRVSTQNQYYTMSLYARVLPNMTTRVDVSVNRATAQGMYSQLLDLDSSGMVQPWEPVTIQVQGLSGVGQGSSVFVVYSDSSAPDCAQSCPMTYSPVIAKVLQADARTNGLWLTVSLPIPIAVQSLRNIYVESISATYEVGTIAP